ncbi:MAG: phage tail protein I [Mariprofundus sp.]|nr:phage tail protein I [Mariprofundus sp.]
MSDRTSLLPPNATHLERNIEQVTAKMIELNVPIRDLWNPEKCPEVALPWLAWALSVEPWGQYWPVWRQREVIKASIPTHRIKGTVAAVKQVLTAAGFPDAVVLEGLHRATYNGQITYDGLYVHGDPAAWATYRIILPRPMSNPQASFVRALLAEADRAVSKLLSLEYTEVPNTYNGKSFYDGAYNYGAA